jgi:hypothetical protein
MPTRFELSRVVLDTYLLSPGHRLIERRPFAHRAGCRRHPDGLPTPDRIIQGLRTVLHEHGNQYTSYDHVSATLLVIAVLSTVGAENPVTVCDQGLPGQATSQLQLAGCPA